MNTPNANQALARAAELMAKLRAAIAAAVVGQDEVVEQVLVALLASGHVLIEGVPGLGKTLLVRALAQALSVAHARVQFTPDLMPSDITGRAVLDTKTRSCASCAARCSRTSCSPTRSIARRRRRRARCSR